LLGRVRIVAPVVETTEFFNNYDVRGRLERADIDRDSFDRAVDEDLKELEDDRAAAEPQTMTAVAPVVARMRLMSADYLEERVEPT
jgi:hypothetical protein